jgi:hypothetical protein
MTQYASDILKVIPQFRQAWEKSAYIERAIRTLYANKKNDLDTALTFKKQIEELHTSLAFSVTSMTDFKNAVENLPPDLSKYLGSCIERVKTS